MAATHAVIRGSLPTAATNTVDLTKSSFGTPTAAFGIVSRATADGTRVDDAGMTLFAWDGTSTYSITMCAEDGQADTDTTKDHSETNIEVINADDTVSAYSISTVTDGLRITMDTDNTDDAYLVTVWMFGGTAAGSVGDIAGPAQDTEQTDAHGLGTTPEAVIWFSHMRSTTTQNNNFQMALGVSLSGGAQMGVSYSTRDAVGTSDACSAFHNDRIGAQLNANTISYEMEVTTQDGTNLGITPRTATAGNDHWCYLALDLDGASVDVKALTTPTSTGSDTITSLSFQPDAGMVGLVLNTTEGASSTGADGNSFMAGVTDGTNEYSTSFTDEYDATTTNSFSVANDQLIDIDQSASGSASDEVDATLTSFNSNGRTFNYSAVDGSNAYLGFEFYVGSVVAASGGRLVNGGLVNTGLVNGGLIG